jgi:hypothetical protein
MQAKFMGTVEKTATELTVIYTCYQKDTKRNWALISTSVPKNTCKRKCVAGEELSPAVLFC